MALPDITSETLPAGFLNTRKKRIAITKDYLEFEEYKWCRKKEINLKWDTIKSVSYGMVWMTGAYITTGLKFEMRFKTKENKTYRIQAVALYGIGRQKLHLQFNNLVQWIWETYLGNRADYLYQQFLDGNTLVFSTLQINTEGVKYGNKIIHWERAELLTYHEYFILQDKSSGLNHVKLNYFQDWDAVLIMPLLQHILANRQTG